jgi:hypothetical protein
MHRLSYHSKALVSGPAVFNALYAQAASFNGRADITGALLYMDGRWAQILEGDHEAITSLYDRITRDSRHEHVTLDYVIETESRLFPEWSMGRITDDDKADIPLARIIAATVATDSDARIRQLWSLAETAREPLSDASNTAAATSRGGDPPRPGPHALPPAGEGLRRPTNRQGMSKAILRCRKRDVACEAYPLLANC